MLDWPIFGLETRFNEALRASSKPVESLKRRRGNATDRHADTRLSDPPRAGRGSAALRTRGSTGLVHAASDYGVAPISGHPRSGRNGPGRRGSHRRACTSGSDENEQKSSSGLPKSHDGLQVRVWQLTLESTASSRFLPFAAAHRRERRSSGDRQHPRRATVVRANGEGCHRRRRCPHEHCPSRPSPSSYGVTEHTALRLLPLKERCLRPRLSLALDSTATAILKRRIPRKARNSRGN
jgi:hypothetical protein